MRILRFPNHRGLLGLLFGGGFRRSGLVGA